MPQGYTAIRFEGKEIQAKWDAKPKKYWFVVVDVLSYLFDNPKFYWQKIKEKISNTFEYQSDYYFTCTYGKEKIDIADYQQIINILNISPGDSNKKLELTKWLQYPMPTAIQEEITSSVYSDKYKDESEWNKIIERANSCGVPTEIATSYLNKIIKVIEELKVKEKNNLEKKNREKKVEEPKVEEPKPTDNTQIGNESNQRIEETIIEDNSSRNPHIKKSKNGCFWIFVIVLILILIGMISGTINTGLGIILLLWILGTGGAGFIQQEESENDYEQYIKQVTPKTQSPLSIINNEVSDILRHRMITQTEKALFITSGVQCGIKASVINNLINNKIREYYKSYKRVIKCPNCNEYIPKYSRYCPFCSENVAWQNVKNLTALALSDRTLTELERQTIVEYGENRNINSSEINNYLDAQLKLRLKSYTKVDLRDCPFCGAQIPLVSDECLYCGKPLEHIENSLIITTDIEGREADIIRSENRRMDTQRHGIKNCPDCGSPFPLMSNICTSCGHVLHELNESPLNINNLLIKISNSIKKVDNAPKPKIHQIVGYWIYYIILAISIISFVSGILLHSELGKLIALIGFGVGIASIVFGASKTVRDSKTPAQVADNEYYKARYAYEMYLRQVATLYGDSFEAKPLLTKFGNSIKRLQKERYRNRITITSIIGITAISIIGILSFFNLQRKFDNYISAPSIYDTTWNIPSNAQYVLTISKRLKPYPTENGVEERLNGILCANKGADLTFVLDNDNQSYRWKINKLELLPADSCGIKKELIKRTITIHLLDSNYHQITTLSECIVSTHENCNYHTVMDKGNGHYFVDFWSKDPTSSEDVIYFISERAAYYTIYASNQ